MKINTLSLLENKPNLSILQNNKDISNILSCKDKIIFSLRGGSKTTKELANELNFKSRSIRRSLNELETVGFVLRVKGKKINNHFRYSDKWKLMKKKEISLPKNCICIHYRTEHYNKSFKNHYLFLPRILFLNEETLTSLGFFHAEGSKTKPRSVEVTNSEPYLIKIFIKFFKNLGIDSIDYFWRIIFNKKIRYRLNEDLINLLEKKSKQYWLNYCNLSINKFVNFVYTGTSIGNLRKNFVYLGSLNLQYNNKLFRLFLFSLIRNVKKLLLEDSKLTLPYLRGYLAGEAYVGSHDREIQFASKNIEELYFFKKLLKSLNIKCSVSKKTSTSPPRIIITNLCSFLIFYSFDIFKFHPLKKKALLLKILKYKNLDNQKRKSIKRELENINELIATREKSFKLLINQIKSSQ